MPFLDLNGLKHLVYKITTKISEEKQQAINIASNDATQKVSVVQQAVESATQKAYDAQETANNAMPKTGGTFTGDIQVDANISSTGDSTLNNIKTKQIKFIGNNNNNATIDQNGLTLFNYGQNEYGMIGWNVNNDIVIRTPSSKKVIFNTTTGEPSDTYASSFTSQRTDGTNGAFISPGVIAVYVNDNGVSSFDRTYISGESERLRIVKKKNNNIEEPADVYANSFTAGSPQDFHAYIDNNFGFGIWTNGQKRIGLSWEGNNLILVAQDNVEFRSGNTSSSPFIAIDALSFNQKSSKRYKHNIQSMTDDCAKKILNLRPVSFIYNNDPSNMHTYGMIAEEVELVDKTACSYRNGVVDSIDYSKFVPQLIKLCQIQQKEIDELKIQMEKIKK